MQQQEQQRQEPQEQQQRARSHQHPAAVPVLATAMCCLAGHPAGCCVGGQAAAASSAVVAGGHCISFKSHCAQHWEHLYVHAFSMYGVAHGAACRQLHVSRSKGSSASSSKTPHVLIDNSSNVLVAISDGVQHMLAVCRLNVVTASTMQAWCTFCICNVV